MRSIYFFSNLLTDSLTPSESEVTLFFVVDLDMPPSNQRMRFIKPLLHFMSHIILLIRPLRCQFSFSMR